MKKNKIYLDNCCFNRPFDSHDQEKILLETEAKLRIQVMVSAEAIAAKGIDAKDTVHIACAVVTDAWAARTCFSPRIMT